MSCVQNDFTYRFNVTLGVLQKYFFQRTDIEKSKKGDSDQQHNTGPEDVLADQTSTERPKNRHNRSNKRYKKPWQPGLLDCLEAETAFHMERLNLSEA
jgi:hypothetical protein